MVILFIKIFIIIITTTTLKIIITIIIIILITFYSNYNKYIERRTNIRARCDCFIMDLFEYCLESLRWN